MFMKKIYISVSIILLLSASRFIPHPPNFTSLIALSFYIPIIFGLRYLPILLLGFLITDLVIGTHSLMLYTFGSVCLISFTSHIFKKNLLWRILGSLHGAIIFFILTNFGVWTTGIYGLTIKGIINCYFLALPFFTYTIISTVVFSSIIETVHFFKVLPFFSLKKQK